MDDLVGTVADCFDIYEHATPGLEGEIDIYRVAENADGVPTLYVTTAYRKGMKVKLPSGRWADRCEVNYSQIAAIYEYIANQRDKVKAANPAQRFIINRAIRAAMDIRQKSPVRAVRL